MNGTPKVRWKKGNRWRYGLWHGLARGTDGSLTVSERERSDDPKGVRCRSLPPTAVEARQPGPRGGNRWVAATHLQEVRS